MKQIKLLLLMVCTIMVTTLSAQRTDAVVVGHVVNKESGEHLAYASVTIKGTTIGTVTDGTGHYTLSNLPVGSFTIVASSAGYSTEEFEIETVAKKTIECKFELEEQLIAVDQIVISSTKNETNKKYSATIVNVASTKLFENTASSTLAETMSFQSGLRIESTCGNCGSVQLRINGLEGQYTQVLLDSRPIFSSLAGVYGLEQLPVSMIERVEVIRGGGSALFGSSAIGGVVNIITKEPLRSSATISNTTNVLKGGTTDITTSLNSSFVSDDQKAGVYVFGMIKDREAYDRNEDGFSDVPTMSSETIGFRGFYKTSNYSKITAEYHHISEYRRGGDNLDLPAHEAFIAEQIEHDIHGGGLNYDYLSPNFKHKFNVYGSAQVIGRDTYYGADQDPDAYGHTDDKTFVAGAQYNYSYNWLLPANFTFGAEYNYNDMHDVMEGYDRDLKQTTNIMGAFVQNEWSSDKLNFVVGGRLDKHNLIDEAIFSPRASLRFSPTENAGFRVSYSSGFRAPQAFNEDLHIEAVAGGVSLIELDPDLTPEFSHSFTASADLYHSFGEVQANLLIEGFYTKLDDVFTLDIKDEVDGNIIWERSNGSGATVKGISAELMFGIPNTFEIQAGYTFQDSKYTEAEEWSEDVEATRTMFRSPDQYGYITANVNITPAFKASVFGNYTGTMLVQHCEGYALQDENVWTETFWDFGVKLSYDIALTSLFNVELSAGVKNIFDEYQSDVEVGQYKDAGYVYGPSLPRTVFFGAKFSF
ncbi:MAG: TonB-dependent receptor [Rikenellaceae bacterium]